MEFSEKGQQDLLQAYHADSRQLEQSWARHTVEDGREDCHRLSIQSRELVSRCILSGDPRSILCLIGECKVLLMVLGHNREADLLGVALLYLISQWGEFSLDK